MRRVQRRPYLTPQPDRVVVQQWMHQIGDQFAPLGQRLPSWDPADDLLVRGEALVDIAGIYQDCRLESDAQVRVVLLWESAGTKLRGSGGSVNLSYPGALGIIPLTVEIDGKLLSGSLTLSIKLLFIHPGRTSHQLIPKVAGSILLETPPYKVQLEGGGARFPTEIIDFTIPHYPPDALWYLSWDPDDLGQQFLGDVRLYMNSRHPQIALAISQTSEAQGIREAMRLDLAQTLIRGALANIEFLENPDRFEPGTVGAVVRAIIRLYFEGYELENIRSLTHSPHSFSAHLQEKMKIFSNEQ